MSNSQEHTSFNAPQLPPSGRPESLEVHLAAVEYALSSAIIIRDEDDIQSARHWSETLSPFHHQIRNLITFCRRAPVALFADDVGLGKTISAGLILSELMTRGKVGRTIVICPAILMQQWKSELKEKFGINADYISGQALVHLLNSNAPVVITTYQSASRYIDEIREAGFDMMILDEAHKLKSLYGTSRPAQMAKRIHEALGDHVFKYVLMLTATPIQNSAWDLYSLIDALAVARYHANPFGSPEQFENAYLMYEGQKRYGRPTYLRPEKRDKFRQLMSEYMVRTSRATARLPFPVRSVRLRKVQAREAEASMTSILKEHLDRLRPVETLSLALASMSSPAAFAAQLENMARKEERTAWLTDSADRSRELALVSPAGAKISTLLRVVQELRRERRDDFRIVVFTNRKETQNAIGKALEQTGLHVGFIRGGERAKNEKAIRDFHTTPPAVNVIVSTDAGAEGINLQVCNVLVNYDLPWNPMVLEQRIGRVQRLGSNFDSVSVINLAVKDSLEERVVARLLVKLQTITNALGDVEAILEAASRSGDEGSFEKEIEKIVLESLREIPVEQKVADVEANIAAAQEAYEREQEVVNDTLGQDLDAMHAMGPRMPPLDPVVPRMDIPTFVRSAYESDGARIQELDDGRLRIQSRGHQSFVATFNRDDPELRRAGRLTGMAGANVRLFEEGARDFEQLVGSWSQRRVHLTHDVSRASEKNIDHSLRAWLSEHGERFELTQFHVRTRTPKFRGRASIRASVAVTHDRLERLISVDVGDPTFVPIQATDAYFNDVLEPIDVDEDLEPKVGQAVEGQEDLAQFAAFYVARGKEEVSKQATDEQREAIHRNFTPYFAGQLEAVHGYRTELVEVDAEFTIDGAGPYPVTLRLQSGDVVESPQEAKCAATGFSVPESILAACDITQKLALPHTLVTSQESGRLGLPSETTRCEVTGRVLLRDEVAVSRVSGRTVGVDQLVRCPVTNEQALESELVACEFSGVRVSPEALKVSDISEKYGRADQMMASAVSGTVGHTSELQQCAATGAWLLASETTTSNVSNKAVRADQIVHPKYHPHIKAHPSELIRCGLTGALLLAADSETSVVSGTVCDRNEMAQSEKSKRWALPSELVECAETGARLLKSETGTCSETKARVGLDQLMRNDFTGTKMLGRLLRQCPETGRNGRVADLAVCEATGSLVDPAVTTSCTETGKTVLQRLTVECAECGKRLLRDAGVVTFGHEVVHPDHSGICRWSGRVYRSSQLGRCTASGVTIAAEFIGPNRRAVVFDDLEESIRNGAKPVGRETQKVIVGTLRSAGMRASRAWVEHGQNPETVAVVFEVRGALGFRRKLHARFFKSSLSDVLID